MADDLRGAPVIVSQSSIGSHRSIERQAEEAVYNVLWLGPASHSAQREVYAENFRRNVTFVNLYSRDYSKRPCDEW
jgi:hypothetical protein